MMNSHRNTEFLTDHIKSQTGHKFQCQCMSTPKGIKQTPRYHSKQLLIMSTPTIIPDNEHRLGKVQACIEKCNSKLLTFSVYYFLINPWPTVNQAQEWLACLMV